ncbi:MAG: epoxyqueuosine reductase QueH [Candidatus Omnitrophica bacterium]|nr:epoxyqueuosine reductase QueH [Candidatus Omnitrophota bacterium]
MAKKLFLHICCAPCSAGIIEGLIENAWEIRVFFYNPNIFPLEEYLRRKNEVARFLESRGIPWIDGDYDHEQWSSAVQGLEKEPERGQRCAVCFSLRLSAAAAAAVKNGFYLFATTVGISRWKDIEQVNAAGRASAALYSGLTFWDMNWRKGSGSLRMAETAKRENFYRQKYCGCVYSQNREIGIT